jgi:hypothetical protein
MSRRLLSVWLAAVTVLGCGGNEFQGDGGGSGQGGTGGSPSGGSGPTGGTGGMPTGGTGGMSGSGPTGGSAGMGGMGGMPCTCPPTQYCRGGQCLSCAELSTLDFGEPEVLLDDPAASLRFPRTGDTPASLFYRSGADGSGRLFYTPSTSALGTFVGNDASPPQSGPLFVDALDRTFNVIYDQSADSRRTMRAATWDGTTLGSETFMPSPLSPAGWDTYSVAAATALDPARLFWMSNRNGPITLNTGLIDSGDGDTIINIEVPQRNGSATCPRDDGDATPWVSPAGRRMFFRALPLDADCQAIDGTTTDLFVVPLVPETGAAAQAAIELESLNEIGTTETDPSLSADFCTLYFASDRNSPGDFKLYSAPRQ